jgi:hypothetical protein
MSKEYFLTDFSNVDGIYFNELSNLTTSTKKCPHDNVQVVMSTRQCPSDHPLILLRLEECTKMKKSNKK